MYPLDTVCLKFKMVLKFNAENLFVCELKTQYNLPDTENCVKFVCECSIVHAFRVNDKFLGTPAMQNEYG